METQTSRSHIPLSGSVAGFCSLFEPEKLREITLSSVLAIKHEIIPVIDLPEGSVSTPT